MNDISNAIEPRSDQLNADDLVSGPMAATITAVDVKQNAREQPISIMLDAWHRPWKPCKSMARVMAAVWGRDSSQWVGQGVTLFNDPNVRWAGVAVGGIRISHITGINKDSTFNLTVTRGKRQPFVVKPMQPSGGVQQQPIQTPAQAPKEQPRQPTQAEIDHHAKTLEMAGDMDQLVAAWGRIPTHIKNSLIEVKDKCKADIEGSKPEPVQDAGIEEF